ncbi:LysR family transcriptional regulator [Actinoallomurus iriomotensis]|uniref:LysR family transcriptional regulator n=1 Tax=Actinoallomurus iriomotensis TaxID=478107 RepID=UPI002553CFA9|nr:LysR family transcriptional regulator [Actinoallomurus iriomotensis]
MNLASLDLNLLVALDALLEQRSVTRAAEQLHLSQPALSASLARLRRHFNDQLLTRVGNEYRLTPLAVRLKERTREAVGSIERVFSAESDFDPATSRREFSLALSDYATAVFGATLAAQLSAEAPHARLRFIANTPSFVDRAHQLLLGVDLLVMPHGFLTDLSCEDLYEDDWVCVTSVDNPAAEKGLTVDDLRTLPWVLTYYGPTAATPASRQLQLLGIEPTAQVITENFLTIPDLVAGTDRIAVLQRRLADRLPTDTDIRVAQCPVPLTPLVEAMWWHPIYDDDPEHTYVRNLVLRATETLRRPA